MGSARHATALAFLAFAIAVSARVHGAFTGLPNRTPRATVSGIIAARDGHPLLSGAVIMIPVENGGGSATASRNVTILPNGSFSFRDVPPGQYRIRARAEVERGGILLCGTFAVTVEGQDIANIKMILVPGGSIDGTLALERTSIARLTGLHALRVRAPFADGSSFGDTPTGDVGVNGAFRIRGIMAGTHSISVEGLPEAWMLKSVTHRGQEVVDVPFDVAPGERLHGVRVTMTEVASQVAGVVREDGGKAAPDTTVIVLPLSPQFWTRASRRFRVARTGPDGRYQVRGLPAGEYRAAAFRDIEPEAASRPDLLRRVAASGVPLSVGERDSRTIDLTVASNPFPVR